MQHRKHAALYFHVLALAAYIFNSSPFESEYGHLHKRGNCKQYNRIFKFAHEAPEITRCGTAAAASALGNNPGVGSIPKHNAWYPRIHDFHVS